MDAAAAPLHHRRAAVEGIEAVEQDRPRRKVHLALGLVPTHHEIGRDPHSFLTGYISSIFAHSFAVFSLFSPS